MKIHAPTTSKLGQSGTLFIEGVNFKSTQAIVARFAKKGVRFLITAIHVVSRSVASVTKGATVAVKEASEEEFTPATLSTALSGDNNDLDFTAKLIGSYGNQISIAYINPATPSADLSVEVLGKDITVNLATDAGTAQVETATVVAESGATGSGDLDVTVTSALLDNPIVVPVSLVQATHTTAALIAEAIRTALFNNATISEHFIVGGSDDAVVLTAKKGAANDATLNIAIEGALGVTAVTDSTNTTAGVAPAIITTADQIKEAIAAHAEANALVQVADKTGNDGSGVVTAMAKTALTNGADYSTGEDIVESTNLADTDKVGLIQSLTLASDKEVVEGGRGIEFAVTTGSTATTDVKDIVVEYIVC